MIDVKDFYNYLQKKEIDTFFGVPDSLLKDICAYITENTLPEKHIITANEGNAVALASGHYMATGKPALVYMQNSGLGNTVNPLISLADEDVYKIPMLLMVGWRGEPGVHDEPQHVKQGKITLPLLETMGIEYLVLSEDFQKDIDTATEYIKKESKSFALVIKKKTFDNHPLVKKTSSLPLSREEALGLLLKRFHKDAIIVSTTGKQSREVFELREKYNESHEKDFLTVGSMGHTASIALGISLATTKKVYCIDGDGSAIMHLGSLGIAAQNAKENFKYILINNGAHESVGGQPTVGFNIDFEQIFRGLGFKKTFKATTENGIKEAFKEFDKEPLSVLIIEVNQQSRKDLGRPTTTPQENKKAFMEFIQKKE